MKELRERLEGLGLSQYFEALVSEGFDSWETLLDVTEADLEHLNVKLGHRRKLQRAIADVRGVAPDKALPPSLRRASLDASHRSDESGTETRDAGRSNLNNAAPGSNGTKRKYRRHPKPDDNAPERPASAYVIFSNQVREKLKGQDMSFTEIAKIVGERWQVLKPDIRDAVERQAAAAKEKYYAELAQYKKTSQYAQYQEYLTEFRAKHGAPQRGGSASTTPKTTFESSSAAEGKRPKLEMQNSTSTRSSSQGDPYERPIDRNPSHAASDALYHLARSGSSPPGGSHSHPAYATYALGPPSTSVSPAAYPHGAHSPSARDTFSPSTTSPAAATVLSAYELPHHARAPTMAELRARENVPSVPIGLPTQSSAPTPLEQDPRVAQMASRRTATPTKLPPLVHDNTSLSDSSLPPLLPPLTNLSSSSLLPALDAPKEERTLPVSAAISSLLISPATPLSRAPSTPLSARVKTESPWPALLLATELARDADLQTRPGQPPIDRDAEQRFRADP